MSSIEDFSSFSANLFGVDLGLICFVTRLRVASHFIFVTMIFKIPSSRFLSSVELQIPYKNKISFYEL